MIQLFVDVPQTCQIEKKITSYQDDSMLTLELTFKENKTYQKDDFFIGFMVTDVNKDKTFLMTHEQNVDYYALPFAFPAFMGQFESYEVRKGAWMTTDYFKMHQAFRVYQKSMNDTVVKFGLTNDVFDVKIDEKIVLNLIFHIYENDAPRLTSMIHACAVHILNQSTLKSSSKTSYTTNIHNYEDACYGLSNDLLDHRARIKDGTGTFIPYGYLEKKPYSESFALMDVAKGMLPYAITLKNKPLLTMIYEELLKITDDSKDFPWIDDDHHTEGFFHLAWGSLPVGVTKEFIKKQSIGLFSDVDGHEEGPNLLSTWKYFYRVEILGEMALLSNKEDLIKGFKKTLPFVGKLKNSKYEQPVTYDLDTHLPATGARDGGSAGGAAFWSMIQLTAYHITKDVFYLEEALKGLKHGNSLDFDHYYSMRVAPKPITVGWLTKANVYAFELTKDIQYIKYAEETAKSIYFFYYLSAHPYTYFSAKGYGYACSRERWEAFLEMVESLYSISFYLKYNKDLTLLKLFWYARENWLWALPLNGNPYGNLDRPYDSIGGTYIPYEFSTGSLGDNPGLDGGSQSSMRQIKEIYGSGEVYLAYMMFEMYAQVTDRNFLIVKSDKVNDLLNPMLNFIVYNPKEKKDSCITRFNNLEHDSYEVFLNGMSIGTYHKSNLMLGIPFEIERESQIIVKLKPIQIDISPIEMIQTDAIINAIGFENIQLKWEPSSHEGHTHYRIVVKNNFYVRTYDVIDTSFTCTIDRELEHQIECISVTPKTAYMYDLLTLKPKQGMLVYRFNESKKNQLNYQHADLIYDGHLWMFYGFKNVSSIEVSVDINQTFDLNDLVQLEVSSLNDGCSYDVYLHHKNNQVTKILNRKIPELIEIKISDCTSSMIKSIEIRVSGHQGLGFSLKRLDVIKNINREHDMAMFMDNVIPLRKQNTYQVEGIIDTSIGEFIDIYVEGLTENANLKVYFNQEEVWMDIEKKYPEKICRQMNGVYRFKSNKSMDTRLTIVSNSQVMKVYAIRVTNQLQYPKYAEYKRCKEYNDEK